MYKLALWIQITHYLLLLILLLLLPEEWFMKIKEWVWECKALEVTTDLSCCLYHPKASAEPFCSDNIVYQNVSPKKIGTVWRIDSWIVGILWGKANPLLQFLLASCHIYFRCMSRKHHEPCSKILWLWWGHQTGFCHRFLQLHKLPSPFLIHKFKTFLLQNAMRTQNMGSILLLEFYSSPNTFRSHPAPIPKMPLR